MSRLSSQDLNSLLPNLIRMKIAYSGSHDSANITTTATNILIVFIYTKTTKYKWTIISCNQGIINNSTLDRCCIRSS